MRGTVWFLRCVLTHVAAHALCVLPLLFAAVRFIGAALRGARMSRLKGLGTDDPVFNMSKLSKIDAESYQPWLRVIMRHSQLFEDNRRHTIIAPSWWRRHSEHGAKPVHEFFAYTNGMRSRLPTVVAMRACWLCKHTVRRGKQTRQSRVDPPPALFFSAVSLV